MIELLELVKGLFYESINKGEVFVSLTGNLALFCFIFDSTLHGLIVESSFIIVYDYNFSEFDSFTLNNLNLFVVNTDVGVNLNVVGNLVVFTKIFAVAVVGSLFFAIIIAGLVNNLFRAVSVFATALEVFNSVDVVGWDNLIRFIAD